MITFVKGDLLDSGCDYICHQVNCQGVMGAGIARQIRLKWPEVYEQYLEFYSHWEDPDEQLGLVDFVYLNDDDRYVVNIYSQCSYGRVDGRYTSYDALADALEEIARSVPEGYTIGFPKNIGCGLGGGNWNIVLTMIKEILGDSHDVYIYELDT